MSRAVLAAVLLLGTVPIVSAQTVSSTTGAINGTVTDKTKGVLPGVAVTIASPALMGTRNVVTSEEGQYRFAAVPPGEYKVTFELPGFATVIREGIRVGLGFTASVNVEMELATQQESVTVIGQSPVVDTNSTKVATNYTAEQMANLPTARDYAALMSTAPAVKVNRIDVGGSTALSENSYRTYGMQGQDRPLVEGMLASENTSLLFYTDYGSFQEVSIATASNSAEMPGPGVYTQFIAKSGGNEYRGGLYIDYYNQDFSTRNIDDDQIRAGLTGGGNVDVRDLNRTSRYRDLNMDLGGFILKDRLWWYGSYRKSLNEVAKPNFPVRPQYTQVVNRTAKLTYQINSGNRLIAFLNHNNKSQPDRLSADLLYFEEDATWNQIGFPVGVWKGEWNGVLSDRAFFEVRAGQYFYSWKNRGKSNRLRYQDLVTNVVSGSDRFFDNDRARPQVHGSLSYFKEDWAGTHNFKFGLEVMDETFDDIQSGFPGDLLHYLRDGVPSEVALYETPNVSRNGLRTRGFYATDTWQMPNRVTLTYGLRFDRYQNYLPEQIHPVSRFNATEDRFEEVSELATFNNWGPRVGGSWNIFGDGRTVLKANVGLFRNSPGVSLFNPNPSLWFRRYRWTDLNNNRTWDPGEEGTLLSAAGGITNEGIDPDLNVATTREVAVFIERELLPSFGVRTGFVTRHQSDLLGRRDRNRPFEAFNVPVTFQDPGPDDQVGTADDGGEIRGFNLDPAALARTPFNLRTSHPDQHNDYYTWEITGTRRMSNRWSLVASFAKTWTRESPYAATPNVAINPNALINAEDGRRKSSVWQSKLLATLDIPWALRVSPILRLESGLPWARTFSARFNYGTETLLAEPFGTRRLDNIYVFDVRVERGVRIRSHRVAAFFDVFNVLNANPEQTIIQTSGRSFMRPTVVVPPRVARLGAKLEW